MMKRHTPLLKYWFLSVFSLITFLAGAQQGNIVGVVNNEKGIALPRATIVLKNAATKKQKTIASDSLGYFRFDNVSVRETYDITVSNVGYITKTITGYRPKENENANVIVTLIEDPNALQDVVVTGYQNIAKTRFTGSAVKLKAEDVVVDGQVDVSRMLQGKAAGVSVQNVSGTFGSAPKIRIRGATSLSGDNKPLWVVDGIVLEDIVPISNDQLSSGDPSTLLGSSVAGLNANDIESFDILKDAAATALYGGRAMNGVIVITTKKGKAGVTKINYTGNFTTALKPSYNNYNIMNSADQMSAYLELQEKGFLNLADIGNRANWGVYGKMYSLLNSYDPLTNTFALANTPQAKDQWLRRHALANTNWFKVLFKNQLVQEHNLSFSTGTEKMQSFTSVSYYADNGWTIADKVKRLTLNINNNYNISKNLVASIGFKGSYRDQRAPGANSRKSNPVNGEYDRDFDINPFSYALNSSRALTPYDENGNLEFYQMNYAPFNILYELQNNYMKVNVIDVQLQGELKYRFSKNIDYAFLGAGRLVSTNTESIIDEKSNAAQAYRADYNSQVASGNRLLYSDPDHPNDQPVIILPQGGFYNKAENYLKTYNIRNTFNYHNTFNQIHYLSFTLGQEIRSSDRSQFQSVGPGFQYDKGGIPYIDYRFYKKFLEQNNFPYSLVPGFERTASFYATSSYSFKNKYNIMGTFRYDGGNRLGKSSSARWLPTASVGIAWNIDQEPFMKKIPQVNSLKLRASYGLVGSLGAATNATAIYLSQTSIRPYLNEKETELYIKGLENSQLTWEKKHTFDVGIDAGLFQNRLQITLDAYLNKSFDLIDQVKTSGIGGQVLKFANNANLTGQGVEASVSAVIIKTKDFQWTSTLNFGTNKTKITKAEYQPSIWDLIKPAGANLQGYPVEGLFAIDFKKLDGFFGVPYFLNESSVVGTNVYFQASNFSDSTGKTISADKVLKYMGPVNPTFTGGFLNSFKWKGFNLSFFINVQTGNKIRLTPVFKNRYTDLDAFPKEFNNRFAQAGDNTITEMPIVSDHLIVSRLGDNNLYNSYNYSTERVAKGDLIRLQNVSLFYALPESTVQKLGLKSLSVGGTANNVWLIYSDSKLQGQDPEFFNSGGVATPVNKQYTLTLRVGL